MQKYTKRPGTKTYVYNTKSFWSNFIKNQDEPSSSKCLGFIMQFPKLLSIYLNPSLSGIIYKLE